MTWTTRDRGWFTLPDAEQMAKSPCARQDPTWRVWAADEAPAGAAARTAAKGAAARARTLRFMPPDITSKATSCNLLTTICDLPRWAGGRLLSSTGGDWQAGQVIQDTPDGPGRLGQGIDHDRDLVLSRALPRRGELAPTTAIRLRALRRSPGSVLSRPPGAEDRYPGHHSVGDRPGGREEERQPGHLAVGGEVSRAGAHRLHAFSRYSASSSGAFAWRS